MASILAPEKQLMALRLLVEGSSLRSVERIDGVQKKTATRLLVRFGNTCRQFLDEEMRSLTVRPIECDEIQTYVLKRAKNVSAEEEESRPEIGEFYLRTALDMDTKLVPTFVIGNRFGGMARRLMMDLAKRLNMPRPQDWQSDTFEQPVQGGTDGFIAYPEAVDMAFGPYVKFGTIIQEYRNAKRRAGNYSPAEIVTVRP